MPIRVLTATSLVIALALAGCSGDVSRAEVTIDESRMYTRVELQAAAESVLSDGRQCTPCTLLRVAYDEEFSSEHQWLADELRPSPDADVVVFSGAFSVDWRGKDYGLNANSTYENMTWTVARIPPNGSWLVINKGVA